MHKVITAVAALLTTSTIAFAQQDKATDILKSDIDKILASPGKSVDHTVRVLDLGSYQLSVAVVKRGPTGPNGGTAQQRRAGAVPCGTTAIPANSRQAVLGISHDDTAETYIVISGSGTLVTGGEITNGIRSEPDSDVTRILNGPSCIGQIVGNYVARKLNVGDMSVIPAGVPHGWIDITSEVTYLSVRPDPKKVLEAHYVNPAIK